MNINISNFKSQTGTPPESSRDSPSNQSLRTSSRGVVAEGKRSTSSRSSSRDDDSVPRSSTSRAQVRDESTSTTATIATNNTPNSISIGTNTSTGKGKGGRGSGWVTLGSEVDIKVPAPSRDLIKLSISRKRREFGAPNKFSDRDAHDGLVECRPFKNPNYDLTMREADVGVQGVPTLVAAATQTPWHRKVNATTQYEAMELPSELRAIAVRAPQLSSFVARAVDGSLRQALQQNEAINLFCPDFPVQADEESALLGGKTDNVLREIQSFTDLRHSKDKVLACVEWMPNAKGVVAVSCLENASLDERVTQSGKVRSSLILIWNFVDPIHPQALLEAPSDVTIMRFHPSNPTTLVAGCANGQILYYDLAASFKGPNSYQPLKEGDTSGSQRANIPLIPYTVASSIEGSHKTAVADLVWLSSAQEVNKSRHTNTLDPPKGGLEKSGSVQKALGTSSPDNSSQFITIAPDGQILLWDIRFKKDIKEMDLYWMPSYRMALTRTDMREELTLSAVSLAISSTKLFGATEDGEVVLADWGALSEGTKPQSTIYPWHQGPIRSLERSPFFEEIILTVGDWTVAVWKEGSGSQPLLGSPYSTSAVTVGRWSPTRPGVFYVGHADGTIDVWDLVDKAHVPTLTQQVAAGAITSMEFPPSDTTTIISMPAASTTLPTAATATINTASAGVGRVINQLVVGDSQGTLHQLELPKNLVRQATNERGWVDTFFKREAARFVTRHPS